MKHLQRDMEQLHRHVLALSAMTEEMIDSELANFVGDLVTDDGEDGEEAGG